RGALVGTGFGNYWGERLHRGHFNGSTLADDQLKIIQARASENLTKKRMEANIEGGPIGLIGKDRLKYLRYFSDIKNWKMYQFEVGEYQNKEGEWEYVLSFKPTAAASTLKEMKATMKNIYKRIKATRKIHDQPIAGQIYINQTTYAVSKIKFSVPKDYKELICNYTVMAIKHFDYKVEIDYQEIDSKWYLSKIRQEDEFIFVDTTGTDPITTPYKAIAELVIENIQTTSVKKYANEECFANVDQNTLYEYPLEYDSAFWEKYNEIHPIAVIPSAVRKDMEGEKTLEQQFRDRFIRDENMPAPIARKEPTITKIHGKKLVDNYAWLKDTQTPKQNDSIMNYLEAENDYFNNYVIPYKKTHRKIYNEMVWRISRAQESRPTLHNGYWYSTRYERGEEYPVYYRRADSTGAVKEVLLDVREMAKDQPYYAITGYTVAPNNKLLLYSENTDGSDNSMVYMKDLTTGKRLADSLERVVSLAWIADSKAFYYTKQQPKTNRNYQVYRHVIGTAQQDDELIYEEKDPKFSVSVANTKNYKYIFMATGSTSSGEYYFKKGDDTGEFQCIAPRQANFSYDISYHTNDSVFYILTDWDAPNGKLMKVSPENPSKENWELVIPENPNALLTGFKKFKKYMTVQERGNASSNVKIINLETNDSHYIKLKDEAAMIGMGYNPKFDTDTLQISYSSLTEKSKRYHYHMETRKQRIIWRDSVVYSGYRSLKSERVWATASDGTQIPITLVYHKYRVKRGHKYLWLTSYGAYGSGQGLAFPKQAIPLLDRGVVYAIAHVRGGNDMGRHWYEQGKMFQKKNTFTDFIACAERLIEKGFTEKGKIITQGGSAGGLLMGAVANMRPDLFHTIMLDVPFVDVINTMLDDQLPLTTGEYEEWGNPNEKKEFDYMYSYSPYENVKEQAYPNMIFFTGINDQRVSYWEPAKMVAKLRTHNTSDNVILLHTNMSAGHGGGSGRFAFFSDLAYKYAIVFDIINREEKEAKEEEESK
ncbi:MAG: S9 family peptidase, partial [Flammeovirgaceae bacterium]